jgi:hypothetical protein
MRYSAARGRESAGCDGQTVFILKSREAIIQRRQTSNGVDISRLNYRINLMAFTVKKSGVFIFIAIFIVSFLIGYLTRSWDDYGSAKNSPNPINFWQSLSPI